MPAPAPRGRLAGHGRSPASAASSGGRDPAGSAAAAGGVTGRGSVNSGAGSRVRAGPGRGGRPRCRTEACAGRASGTARRRRAASRRLGRGGVRGCGVRFLGGRRFVVRRTGAAGATVAPPSRPGTLSASGSGPDRRGRASVAIERTGRRRAGRRRRCGRCLGRGAAGRAVVGGLAPAWSSTGGSRPGSVRRELGDRVRRPVTAAGASTRGRRPGRRPSRPGCSSIRNCPSSRITLHHSGIPRGGTGEVAATGGHGSPPRAARPVPGRRDGSGTARPDRGAARSAVPCVRSASPFVRSRRAVSRR